MTLQRSFFTDSLVSFLCAAGFCLCLFLFWKDLNAAILRIGEQPVGTISFRYNTAQRRFIDRVLWDRLRNDSPVYNGDVIRTADLSEAVITFAGGDIVDMAPNTLIQIFADKDAARIDFSGGGISVNTSSGMVIASGDKRLIADPGAVLRAAAFGDGALDLAVSEGGAVLENPDGQNASASHAITAGGALVLGAAGEVRAVPRAAAVFPPPGARFLSQTADGLSLEFSWNKINYPADGLTRLEIASDRNFSRFLYAGSTGGSQLELKLPEGTWFWRLYPAGTEAEAEIPYSKITIAASPVPVLISPAEGQSFSYRSRSPSVRFQWTSSQAASSYILEAADNPSLQNPALNLSVRSGAGNQLSTLSSALGQGTWYWRVTPVYGRDFSGTPEPSNTGSFVITRGAELTAPVLTAPADQAIVNLETGRRDILFSWKKENEAASYTLRISASSNMGSPVIERTLADTVFRYGANETAITPGTWYWTVQQTGAEGDSSPASPPRAFSALRGEIVQRQIFPPDNYTVADNLLPDTRFTWKTNLADTYFQISDNAAFDALLIDESAAAEAYTVYSLQAGVYYWRITSPAHGLQSRPRRFTVAESLLPPDLNRPQGVTAMQDGTIIVQQGQPLDFGWQPSEDAEYYAFRLYRGNDTRDPVFEATVFDNKLSVNMDEYEDGAYTWTVQGLARENASSSRRTGLASTGAVTIRHLYRIVLESPRGGREYPGIEASRSPDTARWSSQDPPVNVRYIIARDALLRNIVHSQAGVPFSFVMPRLVAGDYYWTIQAETAYGVNISPQTPSGFRVLPIPPLPVPQNRLPADSALIDAARLRISRDVAFSWSEVNGANGYLLTIFQNTGAARRTVIQTPVLRETGYTVEDLRLLGRGDFFWQVEAVYVMDDSFIEQRGQLQENKLTVDIPLPPQIKTVDSGVLYGK